jgi:hypothetical protein
MPEVENDRKALHAIAGIEEKDGRWVGCAPIVIKHEE